MLPEKRDNIYPLTEENITAILHHYFNLPHGNISWLYESNDLTINQIEWIARTMSIHYKSYTDVKGKKLTTVSQCMSIGIDTFFTPEDNWLGTLAAKQILRDFRDAVISTL